MKSDGKHIQLVGSLHGALVHQRRVQVLATHLATLLPPCSLLDVGCGDGTIARLASQLVPGLEVTGAEYAPRTDCAIPCSSFDGFRLPFPDKSFDGCMLIDVLHHAHDPLALLLDASRISRQFILIKDHLAENFFDRWTLRLMDWVGNRPHGVRLPFTYLSGRQWSELYRHAGLTELKTESRISLYPMPFSFLFGRGLHFISLFSIENEKISRAREAV